MRLMRRKIAAVVMAALCACLGVAGQAKRAITLEDLWAVKRVGAPSLDPRGEWAAVEVTTYSMEENSGTSDIWLLATDGKTQRQLTAHTARDSGPQWSPDGKWIAFTSRREGDEAAQIYIISPAGGEARRVTKLSTGAGSIKWLGDSKRIAFLSSVWPDLKTDAEQSKRTKERAAAKVKAVVTEQTMYRYWDHWISDGREPHVFVANIESGETQDVLAGTGLHLPLTDAGTGDYDFSPDGNELAFVADLAKDPGFDPNADIITLNLVTKQWKNITEDNKAGDGGPRYSPDGKFIAYERTRVPRFEASNNVLTLYDRAAGTRRMLTDAWDRSVGGMTWSSDGKMIYFTAEDKAKVHLWSLSVAGAGGASPRIVVHGGAVGGYEVAGNGAKFVYVNTTMDKPPAVYSATAQADTTNVVKIESFNDALARQWKFGEVKEVMFKGWNDEPVHMYVIYPPEFDAKKKWPLLQAVHGGPHGEWLDQFHFRWNMHLLASRGYVVAAVNFHGSTGWGEKFTDSITGRFGEKELADTERATDHLIAQGYIDPARLVAAGGSFGGFMVAFMNGKTDRYKAYVCHAGVYDYPFQQTASDSVRSRDRALGGWFWENPEIEKQSARAFTANMKTPTLIIHGELDYRVPHAHGLAYYAALKMKQVPTRLVFFPDENHWVLKPQNSRLWHQEVFSWLEKYARPGGE